MNAEKSILTAGGGRLAGVDVADNDNVDMSLIFTASCQRPAADLLYDAL